MIKDYVVMGLIVLIASLIIFSTTMFYEPKATKEVVKCFDRYSNEIKDAICYDEQTLEESQAMKAGIIFVSSFFIVIGSGILIKGITKDEDDYI